MPLEFQLELNNPTPSTGLASGKYLITLYGKYLPKSASSLSITVCDISTKIYSLNETSVSIIAPRITT